MLLLFNKLHGVDATPNSWRIFFEVVKLYITDHATATVYSASTWHTGRPFWGLGVRGATFDEYDLESPNLNLSLVTDHSRWPQ